MTYQQALEKSEDYLRRARQVVDGEARSMAAARGTSVFTADVAELTALGQAHALLAMARMAEPTA